MKSIIYLFTFLMSSSLLAQGVVQSNNFETNNELDIVIAPGADSLWQIGSPDKVYFNEAKSLPNALLTDTLNTYPIGQSTSFEFEFNSNITQFWYPFIQVEWNQKTDMELGADGGVIEASYDNGKAWLNVFDNADFMPAVVGDYQIDTLFNGQVGITGTQDWSWVAICWGTFTGQLPALDGNNLKMRYTFVSDSIDTQQDGWMIDDIYVVKDVIGSTNEQAVLGLSIFPNPTKDELYIDLTEVNTRNGSLQLFNVAGQLLRSENLNSLSNDQHSISMSNFAKGWYFLRVQTQEKTYRASFVKTE